MGKRDLDVGIEGTFVGGHGDVGEVEPVTTVEAALAVVGRGLDVTVEVVEDEGAGDLPRPIPAVVDEENRVAVLDPRAPGIADGARGDELVTFLARTPRVVVVILDRFAGRGEVGYGVAAAGQAVVGALHPVPAVVSIHRPVAPAQGGDLTHAELGAFRLGLADVTAAGERARCRVRR